MPKTVSLYLQWAAIVLLTALVFVLAFTGHPIDLGQAAAIIGGQLGLSAKAVATMTSAASAAGTDTKAIVAATPASHVDAKTLEAIASKVIADYMAAAERAKS